MALKLRALELEVNIGVEDLTLAQRALGLYTNIGVEALTMDQRALGLYVNIGHEALALLLRALGLNVNIGHEALALLLRALGLYVNIADLPPFPFLDYIDPVSGQAGTVVTLYGNGFGNEQGTQRVELHGAVQSISVWAWHTIEIVIQPGSTSGYIRVIRPDPTLYISEAKYFRVEFVEISGAPYFEIHIYDEAGNMVQVLRNAK